MSEPGVKHDAGKRPWHLFPWHAAGLVVDVLAFGAQKYRPNNWLYVEKARTRYFDAAQRHLIAWQEGERFDLETGMNHLAHACCCILFLLARDTLGTLDVAPAQTISEPVMSSVRPEVVVE